MSRATGNCLFGALVLRLSDRREMRLRMRWEGGLPHFYCVDSFENAHYFRYEKDWGPFRWKLWWLWYRGRYVTLPEEKLNYRMPKSEVDARHA